MYSAFGLLSDTFRANGTFEHFTPFPVEEGFYVAKAPAPRTLLVPQAAYNVLTKPGNATYRVQNQKNKKQTKDMILSIKATGKSVAKPVVKPVPKPASPTVVRR